MQTHGGPAAEKAILSSERRITPTVSVDWNNNGFYDHPLSHLFEEIESISVDRTLSGSAPSEILLVEGSSAAELRMTVSGTYDGQTMAQQFSPFNRKSAFNNRNLVGSEIKYSLVVETDFGTVSYPQFTGFIRTISPNRADGTVEITALDRSELLRKDIQLPPWAVSDEHAAYGEIEVQSCYSDWVIDNCLRLCDMSHGAKRPAFRSELNVPDDTPDGLLLFVSGNNSYLPTVGYIDNLNAWSFPNTSLPQEPTTPGPGQPPPPPPPATSEPGIRRPLSAPANPTVTVTSGSALQGVLDNAAPGDLIYLRGDLGSADVDLNNSGTAGNPIKIVSDGTAKFKGLDVNADYVELKGFNIVQGNGGSLSIKGNNILIEDVLVDSPGDGQNGDACRFWGSFLTFRHCTFRNTNNDYGHADAMQNYSTSTSFPRTHDILIENCSMEDIDNIGVIMEGPDSSYGDGDGQGDTYNVTIRGCYFQARSAQAIWFDDVQDWTVVDCVFDEGPHHALGVTNGSTGGTLENNQYHSSIGCRIGMDSSSNNNYTGPEPECDP